MKKSWVMLAALSLLVLPLAAAEGVVVTRADAGAMISGPSDAKPRPAAPGAVCNTLDTIETRSSGSADIAIHEMAGCRLLPSTKCKIMNANDQMKIAVVEGNVILNIKKLPAGSTFEVETPTAIASVRGTQFWGRVLPAGSQTDPNKTTFAVKEGKVDVTVKSMKRSVSLEAGEAVDVPLDGSALPPSRRATADEMKAMEQAPEIAPSA
jgi:hypothetical protein